MTVVVRTKDSEPTLVDALEGLRAQTVPVHVVVVDSGSQDGTLAIANGLADVVLEMSPGGFSFGRSLNLGIAAARSGVVFALSSHVVPPSPRWIEDSLAHYADPVVVAVCGAQDDPWGRTLGGVVRQDLQHAREHPRWGLANTAASWRRDAVLTQPFDELLEACEDKEWALRALGRGGVVVVDPALAVDSSHRTGHGWRRYYERARREELALIRMGAIPVLPVRLVVRGWWREAVHSAPGRRGLTSVSRLVEHCARASAHRGWRTGSVLHSALVT